ncbi:MAG: hypothetical protein ACXWCZ_00880 [Flavisolibacter sp.]
MRLIKLFQFFIIASITVACNNNEDDIGSSRNVNPESIYFDYIISADEESQNVLSMFKFRVGGPEGTTLLLKNPSKVELDGEQIEADSARFTGVYYERVKPIRDFVGKHTIKFTASNNKEYVQEFEFKPFSLSEELPQTISRKVFAIQLRDFPVKETGLHIVMIDTAYATNDVNERVVIENGRVLISPFMLNQLKNGPISIELTGEEQKSIQNRTKAGGKLSLRYGLKREFVLTD